MKLREWWLHTQSLLLKIIKVIKSSRTRLEKIFNISRNIKNVVCYLLVKLKANFAYLGLNGRSIFKRTLNKMSYLHATVSHGKVSSGQSVMCLQVSHGYVPSGQSRLPVSGQSRKCAFESVTETCLQVSHGNVISGQSRKYVFRSVTKM
jgi:hypothetical protein